MTDKLLYLSFLFGGLINDASEYQTKSIKINPVRPFRANHPVLEYEPGTRKNPLGDS